LYEEVAVIAQEFHWPRSEIVAMEHWERRLWAEFIAKAYSTARVQERS